MAEREKNAAFWKQMRAIHTRRVAEYAKKYDLSLKQASLELQWKDMLDQDDRQFLIEEGLRLDSSSHRCEEE